jgi:hypothetical protein
MAIRNFRRSSTFTGATAIDPRGEILGRCIVGGVSQGFLLSSRGGYTVTDLGVVGGTPGQAFFVTQNGLASGAGASSNKTQHALLWYKGLQTDLSQPGLGGKNSVAFSARATGEAVGEAEARL